MSDELYRRTHLTYLAFSALSLFVSALFRQAFFRHNSRQKRITSVGGHNLVAESHLVEKRHVDHLVFDTTSNELLALCEECHSISGDQILADPVSGRSPRLRVH